MRIRQEFGHERRVGKAAVPVDACQWHSHGQTEKNHEKHLSGQSITVLRFGNATATATTTCFGNKRRPKILVFVTPQNMITTRGQRWAIE
jgi:hypothetical protein